MKKIKLHWQIFIALVLAVVYGVLFPTYYSFNDQAFDYLKKKNASTEIIQDLRQIADVEYKTRKDFDENVILVLGEQGYEEYKGLILKAANQNTMVHSVSWMGDIFLRLLKMLIIPLILSSLISGIANIGSSSSLGRLSMKTFGYYIMTSLLAILTGLFLVNILQPGLGADLNFSQEVEGLIEKQRSVREILIDIVPTNIFEAFTHSQMLSIIFFAILFGFFVTKIDKAPGKTLTKAFNAIFDVMMKMTMFIIRFTPLGIFGIVAKVVADQDDLLELGSRMGLYMFTVIAALSIHFFITLPAIAKYVGQINPLKHMLILLSL